MTKRRYKTRLSCKEVIRLLKMGIYSVDAATGAVYGHSGKQVTPFEKDGYLFVRLYFDGDFKRIIGVAKLAWMARTLRAVPRGFEVHHRDADPLNNGWDNLYCLYKDDHCKLHGRDLIDAPIPD